MTAATKPDQEQAGTAVAKRIDARVAELRERNALVAAIRSTQWGKDCSPDMQRAVAHYCNENNLDPVRHVEILGGRIYLTTSLYDEKGAHLLREGIIVPDEPEYINADVRLDELAAEGYAEAKDESSRRKFMRAQYNVPEKAAAAVVQRFHIPASGAVIVGVNWCGGGVRQRDPVGDAEPAKTAQTRARRRAWVQIADIIPGYAETIRPIEASARVVSESLPVSVVDAPRAPKALAAGGYDTDTPTPPAQFADDPAASAEQNEEQDDGELPLTGGRVTQPVRRDAIREG